METNFDTWLSIRCYNAILYLHDYIYDDSEIFFRLKYSVGLEVLTKKKLEFFFLRFFSSNFQRSISLQLLVRLVSHFNKIQSKMQGTKFNLKIFCLIKKKCCYILCRLGAEYGN